MRARTFALALATWVGSACRRPSPPPPDVPAVDAAPEVSVARGRRRRRGRATPRARTNGTPAPNGTSVASNDPPDDFEEDPPAPRPRITETGPMLPEDMGPAPEVNYDLGAANDGPMGLEPSQISRGMNPLLGRLTTCAAATTDDNGRGPHGHVTVRLRIHNDGRPMAARVSGGSGPPEFITCCRRVVASARFASFRGPDVLANWGFDVD